MSNSFWFGLKPRRIMRCKRAKYGKNGSHHKRPKKHGGPAKKARATKGRKLTAKPKKNFKYLSDEPGSHPMIGSPREFPFDLEISLEIEPN